MTTATQAGAVRRVPFFNYRGAFTQLGNSLIDTVRDVIDRGAFIMQKDLSEFEAATARYLGVKHAFGVGNATDGLTIAFRAAGLQPGDEVLFPAHTMVALPAAAHFAGGVPVPVDIGPDHMMDPASAEAAITPKTRFIMPVHVNGRTCDMDAITGIAKRHDLIIVEDAAQALGSRFRGKAAGTFGIAAAFSFYPAKVLACLGDGGLVVTDDDNVADRVHQLHDHGRNRDGDVVAWGMNSRLDNVQAAVLHLQFRDYAAMITYRRNLAAQYQAELDGLSEVVPPPAPDVDARHFDVFQNYEIEADQRDQLRAFLAERGVGTLVQWGGKAVHQIDGLGFKVSLPATERFFERCLMLPLNLMVTEQDVSYIAATIREFYGK